MISELVDGSAWMKPPVDGPAEGVTGEVDWVEAPPGAPAGTLGAEGVAVPA